MKAIENADFFVRIVDMPHGIHGCVTPNDDGTFSVYLNAHDNSVRNRQACDHERKHIESDHFCEDDVRDAEAI